MKLAGEATLRAGVAQVYAALNDPAVLVRTLPGCQRLEQVGPDAYRATLQAGVAAIKGTFDGDVRLSDQDAPYSFTLHAAGAGAPGTVSAVVKVALAADDGGTRLTYDADATIGGVIGGVGQRMLSGVARKTAGEFFAAVDRVLAGEAAVPTVPVPVPVPSPAAAVPAARSGRDDPPTEVWHAPAPVVDPTQQRVRDLMMGVAFGAVVALLGVLVGAIVAGW